MVCRRKQRRFRDEFGVGSTVSGTVGLSVGSQVLGHSAFGSIGQQGSKALGVAGKFLPTMSLLNVSGVVLKKVRKINKRSVKR